MKERYRGAKSAHCRLSKSLLSVRVQFGGCDSGGTTDKFPLRIPVVILLDLRVRMLR